jgi:hypothetical protein
VILVQLKTSTFILVNVVLAVFAFLTSLQQTNKINTKGLKNMMVNVGLAGTITVIGIIVSQMDTKQILKELNNKN